MESLHSFFRRQFRASLDAECTAESEEGYRDFLKPINHAIDALTEGDPLSGSSTSHANTEHLDDVTGITANSC
jgi:hypothetical protein